jgi:hypothetical protein
MDGVDDRLVGNADRGQWDRIGDRQLYHPGESWDPVAIGDDQCGWHSDQSASERGFISDGQSLFAVKPENPD